jgi:hypothetical protein
MRYVREQFSDYDAGVLTADRGTGILRSGAGRWRAEAVGNLLTQTGPKIAKEKSAASKSGV